RESDAPFAMSSCGAQALLVLDQRGSPSSPICAAAECRQGTEAAAASQLACATALAWMRARRRTATHSWRGRDALVCSAGELTTAFGANGASRASERGRVLVVLSESAGSGFRDARNVA